MPIYQGDPNQIDEFTADLSAATTPVSLIPLTDGRIWLLGPENSSIIDYDILNVTGGSGKDLLIGGEGRDTLVGGEGNDIIDGGWSDGNDVLVIPNADDDTLIGGAGIDILSYSYADAGVSVSLAQQGTRIDTGNAGNDYIEGFENLTGSKFDDVLTGDAGNNVIDGGRGNDVLDGGAGVDTVSYASAPFSFVNPGLAGVTVSLATIGQQYTGETGWDTLTGFENLTGSAYDDVLGGDAGANVLRGSTGDDTLDGGAGDDTLDGGEGSDWAIYSAATSAVSVSLAAGTAQGGAGNDQLIGIENVVGSSYADTISGNAKANILDGGAGADTLTGGAGDDTYLIDDVNDRTVELAGGGYDTVRVTASSYVLDAQVEAVMLDGNAPQSVTGNALDNLIVASGYDNVIEGGAGIDTVSYVTHYGVDVSLAITGTQATNGSGSDRLTGIENLTGSYGDDRLTGDAGANVLSGLGGSDTLDGGLGDDVLDGGFGSDWVSYASTGQGVTVSLADTVHVTSQGSDTFVSIENLIGSAFDDTLTGDDGDNRLDGGTGNDMLDGSFGYDGADYGRATSSVTVSLLDTGMQNTGGGGIDTLVGIEDLYGSAFGDTLGGDDGVNTLDGRGGNDVLTGFGGNDTYVVQAGDTIVEIENGGYDYAYASTSYTLDAWVEDLVLTGYSTNGTGNELNNTIIGDAGDNVLRGEEGDDTLYGQGGNDTLIGGTGDDRYEVSNVGDVVVEVTGEGYDWVETTLTNYTLAANVEGLRATYNGTGNALDNQLIGSSLANVLDGGAGADTMDGGEGNDTYYVDNVGDVTNDGGSSGGDRVLSSVSYSIGYGIDYLELTGTANINGTGNNGDFNTLVGNAGNNRLDGLGGNDLLIGGSGDDTYVVDTESDRIIETQGGGNDTVESSADFYNLEGQWIESLLLTGTRDSAVHGNRQDNLLTGNSGNNWISGFAGGDTMVGKGGDDIYVVEDERDIVVEAAGEGYDTVQVLGDFFYTLGANIEAASIRGTTKTGLNGNALDNRLTGDGFTNMLNGGAGADTMIGGAGDDFYTADNAGDVVIELNGGGTDTVRASISFNLAGQFIENLTLTGSADIDATGNGLTNLLIGNSGNNVLDGRGGADTMVGDIGDDSYYVDDAGDKVTEIADQGTDTVFASVSYDLSGSFVENLMLLSSQNLNATGNGLANHLQGNSGNNIIDGGSGADTMLGGTGNDTYHVDNVGDIVTEFADQGIDTVISSVAFTLAGTHIEALTLTGTQGLSAKGNGLANTITGNAGNNAIDGGLGADILTGAAGLDIFRFTTALGGGNLDTITDFSVADDTIQMDDAIFSAVGAPGANNTLGAGAFWTGSAAHDADDRIVYDAATGALFYDADGNGAGAAVQFATIGTGLALTNADFVLI